MTRNHAQCLVKRVKRGSLIVLRVSQNVGLLKISLVTPLEKSFSLQINVDICERKAYVFLLVCI